MKKIIFLIFVTAILPTDLFSQKLSQGVGVRLGSYFGGTYKNYLSETSNFDATVAFDWEFATIGLLANYNFIQTDLHQDWEGLDWYLGVGGQLWLGEVSSIGPAGTAGLEYTFEDQPFSIFTDFTLYLGIGEDGGFQPQFSIGGRKNF